MTGADTTVRPSPPSSARSPPASSASSPSTRRCCRSLPGRPVRLRHRRSTGPRSSRSWPGSSPSFRASRTAARSSTAPGCSTAATCRSTSPSPERPGCTSSRRPAWARRRCSAATSSRPQTNPSDALAGRQVRRPVHRGGHRRHGRAAPGAPRRRRAWSSPPPAQQGMTATDECLFRGAARTATATGIPVSIRFGADAMHDLDVVLDEGLPADRVVVGGTGPGGRRRGRGPAGGGRARCVRRHRQRRRQRRRGPT